MATACGITHSFVIHTGQICIRIVCISALNVMGVVGFGYLFFQRITNMYTRCPQTISPNTWNAITSLPYNEALKVARYYLGRFLYQDEIDALNKYYNRDNSDGLPSFPAP
jgi:hypothetical protein